MVEAGNLHAWRPVTAPASRYTLTGGECDDAHCQQGLSYPYGKKFDLTGPQIQQDEDPHCGPKGSGRADMSMSTGSKDGDWPYSIHNRGVWTEDRLAGRHSRRFREEHPRFAPRA